MTKSSPPKPAAKREPSKMAAALLAKADAYATLIDRKRSTVSVYLFNDGKVLDSIAAGADIMTRAYERAHANLDERLAVLKAAAAAPAPKPELVKAKAPAKKAAPKKAAAKPKLATHAKAMTPAQIAAHPLTQPAVPAMQSKAKAAPKKTAKPPVKAKPSAGAAPPA